MTEITIKIPDDVKTLIEEIDEPLFIEAIKDVAKAKLAEKQKELKDLKKKRARFETRYDADLATFSQTMPDNMKSHDDWIEWTLLNRIITEKQKKSASLKRCWADEDFGNAAKFLLNSSTVSHCIYC
jgi:hypothetical protein